MISKETFNKTFKVLELSEKLRRTLSWNEKIITGYGMVAFGMLSALMIAEQNFTSTQENVTYGLLISSLLGGLAEVVNIQRLERKTKQINRIYDRLQTRMNDPELTKLRDQRDSNPQPLP